MVLCSGCDSTNAAADCPHREVLGGRPSAVRAIPRVAVPVRDYDTDWDREKGRWW